MEWVREVVATTLGVAPSGQLPPIIMQQEVPSIWDQIRKLSAVLVSHTVCCQPVLWRQLGCLEGPQNASILRLIDCASHQSLASVQLIRSFVEEVAKKGSYSCFESLLSQQGRCLGKMGCACRMLHALASLLLQRFGKAT